MAYLSFADLIGGPTRLPPAEAAALTLAVARRLDEEGATGFDLCLPDDSGILLSSTGAIAFVRGPEALAPDNRAALSALLMRLMRLDEDGPRAQVPGGLLIVLARNLGYIQLPPTSPAAFRAALERFATSDPALLAGIFWRAARAKGGAAPRRTVTGPPDATQGRVERRRGDPAHAELRRALREVERELFDTRTRLVRRLNAARQGEPVSPEPSMSGMMRWAGIAAGVVLLASIAAGSGTRNARPAPVAPAPAATNADAPRDRPIVNTPAAPAPTSAAAAAVTPAQATRSVVRKASPVRVTTKAVKERPRSPGRERRPVRPDPVTTRFAGGARQIAWTIQR